MFLIIKMTYFDFVIAHDFQTEPIESMASKVIKNVVVKRIDANKPCVIFICGDSGEGKSLTSLRLQEEIALISGWDIFKHIRDVNVCTPIQYPHKLNALLYNKEMKKVNVICMQEARDIVKAKLWHEFATQAIPDVNAMSRSIKPMVFIIVSQSLADISSDMRRTINYFCKVTRPIGKRARMRWEVFYKDDSDPERPKLKKRALRGFVVAPNGTRRMWQPKYWELAKPAKELIEIFETMDKEGKTEILQRKMSKLIREIEADIGTDSDKSIALMEHLLANPDNMAQITKRRGNKLKVLPKAKEIYNLTDKEMKLLQERINKKWEAANDATREADTVPEMRQDNIQPA